MGQTYPLMYFDVYEALRMMVDTNPRGLNIKQVGSELWPERDPETARNTLSRALTGKNKDANLKPHEIVRLMGICGNPEHFIFMLCDAFMRERPRERERRSIERVLKQEALEIRGRLEHLLRHLETPNQVYA